MSYFLVFASVIFGLGCWKAADKAKKDEMPKMAIFWYIVSFVSFATGLAIFAILNRSQF